MTPPPLLPAPGAPGAPEAEEEPVDTPQDSPDSPEGEIIPQEERYPARSGSSRHRIPVAIVLGTVGGVVGAIPGAIMGLEEFCFDACTGGDADRLYLGLGLALGGMTLGSALAITQVGYWMGGQGRFWPTVGGILLGTLGGVLAGAAIGSVAGPVGLVPAVLGPAVGGVIAYELSDRSPREEFIDEYPSEPHVTPLVTVSPRGGFIGGLSGRF